MSGDAAFVFVLIAAAGIAMASNRVRYDVVALVVVLALMLSGVLSVGQALSGFGSSVVILVAALLVIGEMLDRTGVARAVGDMILKRGGTDETRLLILIMVGASVLGSVMSSTAVVAIFIPIVLRIAAETKLNASRMLMPMSYAALISGMLTLIATTPNIVVHEELQGAGFEGFGFFSFAPVGIAVLAVAVVYVVVFARGLLTSEGEGDAGGTRRRSLLELWEGYRANRNHVALQLGLDSPMVGCTIADAALQERFGVGVLGLLRRGRRGEERIVAPAAETQLQGNDLLLVIGEATGLARLAAEEGLTPHPSSDQDRQRWLWELGGAAVLIHPESGLIGRTLREAGFRSRYNLQVLGIRRNGKAVAEFEELTLAPSDSLFVVGSWKNIEQLRSQTHDFVVLEIPAEHAEVVPSYRRMPTALTILAGMVLLTFFDLVPLVAVVLIAALAAVFTRCLTMEDAYRAIHWPSLVLIAGMLPLADALDTTGGTRLIVDALLAAVGEASPYVMLSIIFFLTAGLGLVLSNTASAVLVAPIAIYAAAAIGVSPYPFAVAVLIAASAAYSTPVSTPVVTLVVEPGRYRFTDFVKVGVPLLVLTYLVTLAVAPLIFPFQPG